MDSNRIAMIRQILNLIFMVGAVIGVLVYFYSNHDTGTYIILASIVFKIIECALRLIKWKD
ncbi:MAG: hypothetical protein IJ582_03825 [Prevotella sp.]|nr:hypothetical protein [Prevotella sp.]